MMITHYYLRLIFLGVFLLNIISCGLSDTPDQPSFGPYFWKVTKSGKVSYFLGTRHSGVTLEHLQCSTQIKNHLKSSDYLFTEVGSSDLESVKEFNRIVSEHRKKIISSQLKGQEFKSLAKESQIFFRNRGTSENLSYIGYMIVWESLCEDQGVYATGAGTISLDRQFKAISQAENIPIAYLDADENTPEVAQAYIGLRYDHWKNIDGKYVDKAVAGFEDCISNEVRRINKYINGDLAVGGFNSHDKALLKDRNEQWVAKFKSVWAGGNYNQIFLAGGTAHFIDNFNVLDMLKKDDFSISRMNVQCEFR